MDYRKTVDEERKVWKPNGSSLWKERRNEEDIARAECSYQKPIPEYL
ncbi:MAG: hypothetical protein ABSF24_06055 [Candidatus Bathyarchaeia archaeon]